MLRPSRGPLEAQTWRLGAVLALAPPTPVLAEPVTDMLVAFVPYAPAWMRPLLAGAHSNKSWFVNRLLAWAFRRLLSADTSAFVTNTVALTRMAAGVADNVLPQEATLKFNVRILPGSSPEAVGEYFKWAVGAARVNGEVKVLMEHSNPPSMVTPATGRHFKLLKQAIQETWSEPGKPPLAVVPFLLTGGTDSKNYRNVTRNGILRFVPMGMNKTAGDLGRIHSTNERMKAEYFPRAVCTYMRMMQLMAGPAPAQG
ncbi:hypothetical protein HYH03_001628 [Edaphochlamys debaryana]|uniref:Peptidase M20 dimerisation domain-containing protein n=1 Tax=Edaphochlamys debaryana TaxID=47281 RepID=A0A835YDC6_9CHLO|nr:hypothetical protein HYH03_001628 [Edaphochlamys debaryana]|eukprot:KAG2500867.1 hypothetical protein HYH03_001628 [Edaphochlamys debaryana]